MSPHIIVCIKSVVRSAPDGVARRQAENSELNPFDRPALEAALTVAALGGGTVTALSMGPPVAATALVEAQAMGAHRGVLVSDPALAGSDTLVTARVLAAAIGCLGTFDFIFFGTRSSDSDTGQVGPQTAAVLDLPFVSGVKHIQAQDAHWELKRTMDDWEEHWDVQIPLTVSIHPRAFAPRHVGLIGVAEACDEPNVETLGLSELGLAPSTVGLEGSPTRVVAMQRIKHSRTCDMIGGEPAEQVTTLIERLKARGVWT